MVQDVSNKLVDQFAECIKAQLSAEPEVAAAAMEEAQKPISALAGDRGDPSTIRGLFGRGDGRKREMA